MAALGLPMPIVESQLTTHSLTFAWRHHDGEPD